MNYEIKEILYNNILNYIKSKNLDNLSNDECIIIMEMIRLIISLLGFKYLNDFKEKFKNIYDTIEVKEGDLVLILDESKYYDRVNYGIINSISSDKIIIKYIMSIKKEVNNKIEISLLKQSNKFLLDIKDNIVLDKIKVGYHFKKNDLIIKRLINNNNIPILFF